VSAHQVMRQRLAILTVAAGTRHRVYPANIAHLARRPDVATALLCAQIRTGHHDSTRWRTGRDTMARAIGALTDKVSLGVPAYTALFQEAHTRLSMLGEDPTLTPAICMAVHHPETSSSASTPALPPKPAWPTRRR